MFKIIKNQSPLTNSEILNQSNFNLILSNFKILPFSNNLSFFNFSHYSINPNFTNFNFNHANFLYFVSHEYLNNDNYFLGLTDVTAKKDLISAFYFPEHIENSFIKFSYFKYSTFSNFFIKNQIDVPSCFKKSPSLFRKNNHLTLIKFINFITLHGKREKYTNYFFKAINIFFSYHNELNPSNKSLNNNNYFFHSFNYHWKNLFMYLFSIFYNKESPLLKISLNSSEENPLNFFLNFQQSQSDFYKTPALGFNFKNYLYNLLIPITPVFNFFIYNVDKNIRKFTRGKSGRFLFIWKYISFHKRNNLVLKLVKKNIVFNQGKKYYQKILSTLCELFLYPQNNFLTKSKRFVSQFIYKNFKQSLMIKLKTLK